MAVTGLFAGLCIYKKSQNSESFVKFFDNSVLVYTVIPIELISLCILFSPKIDKKVPLNYILFFVFTVCVNWIVGALCVVVENPIKFFEATGITIAFAIILTIFAVCVKIDFTIRESILSILVLIVTIAMLAFWIFGNQIQQIYAIICVFAYAFFLIYNTQ